MTRAEIRIAAAKKRERQAMEAVGKGAYQYRATPLGHRVAQALREMEG